MIVPPASRSELEIEKENHPRRRLWLLEIWDEKREIYKAITGDTLIFLFLMLALTIVYEAVGKSPYPKERKETFETIHYYGYLTLWVIFLCKLVWEMLIFLFRGKRA